MPWVVWYWLLVVLRLVEESAENMPSSRNMMTLQETDKEQKNNPENRKIKEVEERVYDDNKK